MVLTNDKIRLHVEYAVRCLFHFPTNAQQRVHFRSSIFNLSGHRRMMNVNESAHVFALVPPAMANKVALAFFFWIQTELLPCFFFRKPLIKTKLHDCMCTPTYRHAMLCVSSRFCECMHFVFVLAPAPARCLSGPVGGVKGRGR